MSSVIAQSCNIPSVQFCPINPNGHAQVYEPSLVRMQLPPFLHGSGLHAVTAGREKMT